MEDNLVLTSVVITNEEVDNLVKLFDIFDIKMSKDLETEIALFKKFGNSHQYTLEDQDRFRIALGATITESDHELWTFDDEMKRVVDCIKERLVSLTFRKDLEDSLVDE